MHQGLSERFWEIMADPEDWDAQAEATELVETAPDGPERDGLMALLYYTGWRGGQDYDKAEEYARRAAVHNEGIALYLMGTMCDKGLILVNKDGKMLLPDKEDAILWMEAAAKTPSVWAEDANNWLANHYLESGNNIDKALPYLEATGKNNREAAGKLSDIYWSKYTDSATPAEEIRKKLYEWTLAAAEMDPHGYAFRMGYILDKGIGCNRSFRLGTKYYEDAFDTGIIEGADAIAGMYEERYKDESYPEKEREYCKREMERWQRLAHRARERKAGKDV